MGGPTSVPSSNRALPCSVCNSSRKVNVTPCTVKDNGGHTGSFLPPRRLFSAPAHAAPQCTHVLPLSMYSGRRSLGASPPGPAAPPIITPFPQGGGAATGACAGEGEGEGGLLQGMLDALHRLVRAQASEEPLLAGVGAVLGAAARQLPAATARQVGRGVGTAAQQALLPAAMARQGGVEGRGSCTASAAG